MKDPKKREDHLIFMNLGMEKFIVKRFSKRENFDV
jgi:hypothetical protein